MSRGWSIRDRPRFCALLDSPNVHDRLHRGALQAGVVADREYPTDPRGMNSAAEDAFNHLFARQAVVRGYRAEDGGKRADPERFMVGNGHVMLAWLIAGEAEVASGLSRDPVAYR